MFSRVLLCTAIGNKGSVACRCVNGPRWGIFDLRTLKCSRGDLVLLMSFQTCLFVMWHGMLSGLKGPDWLWDQRAIRGTLTGKWALERQLQRTRRTSCGLRTRGGLLAGRRLPQRGSKGFFSPGRGALQKGKPKAPLQGQDCTGKTV